jgi:hypothetical protein
MNSNLYKFYNLQQFESNMEIRKEFKATWVDSSGGPLAQD